MDKRHWWLIGFRMGTASETAFRLPTCSLSWATTLSGSDLRLHSPNYAAWAPCRHQVARPTAADSTAVATNGRMRFCTASLWFAFATIGRPANTSSGGPPKASYLATSGGASSGTSPAESTNPSALKSRRQHSRKALDQHRGIRDETCVHGPSLQVGGLELGYVRL